MAKRKIFATAEEIARTIVDNGLTVRQAADRFGCGRSSIQNYVNTLAETNPELYAQVKETYKRNHSTKPATICENGEYTLTVTEKSEAPATGHRIGGNTHSVFDLTTGEIYTSGTDAAEKIGVTQASMSWNVTGKSNTCKGHKFIKVSDAQTNISAISNAIKTANKKAELAEENAQMKISEANVKATAEIARVQSEATAEITRVKADAAYNNELAQAQINELHAKNAQISDALAPLKAIKETKTEIKTHNAKAEELYAAYLAELRAIEDAERKLADLYEAL